MPSCPNCHQTILGHANVCYKCNYDFKLKRVVNKQEVQRSEEVRANEIKRIEEAAAKILEEKSERISKNAYYEYAFDIINDLDSGAIDQRALSDSLQHRSQNGWRLVQSFTNEIGKCTSAMGFGGVMGGINATIDSTILIYERCIKIAED